MCSQGKEKVNTVQKGSGVAETAWISFHLYEMVRELFKWSFADSL